MSPTCQVASFSYDYFSTLIMDRSFSWFFVGVRKKVDKFYVIETLIFILIRLICLLYPSLEG